MSSEWRAVTMGDILRLEYGKPLDESKRKSNGKYPVYGANGEKTRTDDYLHDRPSIIVGRKGSAGEVTLTERRFWPLDVSYFATFDEREHDLRFLYYLLGRLDLPRLAKGVKPGINRNEVYSIATRVPSLPEQQRIVALLDQAFAGLATAKANAEKSLQNARALFEIHLESVFTQRGGGWVEHALGDLIEIQNGYAFKSTDYTDAGFFVIRISNVQDGEITLDNPRFIQLADRKLERFILNAGDILVSLTGNIGRVGIIQEFHLPAVLNQRVARITVKNTVVNSDFLFRFLCSRAFLENLQAAGHGAAQQNVSTKEIETVRLSVPSKEVQRRVVEDFDSFARETRRLAHLYENKLTLLEALTKSLLHQAFCGELS